MVDVASGYPAVVSEPQFTLIKRPSPVCFITLWKCSWELRNATRLLEGRELLADAVLCYSGRQLTSGRF